MSGDTRGSRPVGVLVVRVWWESPDLAGLRVHVRAVADIEDGEEEVVATSSIPEAVEVVQAWLHRQATGSAPSS